MAKKDNDNFDFETEGKAKVGFNLDFLKNLTKQQKGIILIVAVAVVLVVAIVITCIALGTNDGSNDGNGGVNNGENNDGTYDGEGVPDVITYFYISTIPAKTSYYVGDIVDYTGLTVYVKSSDGASLFINYNDDPEEFTITGFDSSAPVEEQVITVECKGFTDTYVIQIKEVENAAPKLVSVNFAIYPKQVYNSNDLFEYEDGVLLCTYSDGSTVEIPLLLEYMYGLENVFDLTGKYILLPGEHTIQIEYGENGVFVQTEYTITVN